ncbi:MAG: pantothenate kinase [Epsilonproteobacteria bacterium]|nr:MAG: pantothenate kinase [Campylobacterota bacterium]
MIVCDIGNTHIKFKQNNKIFNLSFDEPMPKFDEKIHYISVCKKGEKILKQNYENTQDMSSIINFDTNYMGLGVDRAVACKYIKDGLIVDAGSAVTVDLVQNFKHKGGYILPGLKAYKKMYKNISQNLNYEQNFDFDIDKDTLPYDTASAISYGVIQSILLLIKNTAKKSKILITGGDGKMLSKYIKNTQYRENLVLNNLEQIIKENRC